LGVDAGVTYVAPAEIAEPGEQPDAPIIDSPASKEPTDTIVVTAPTDEATDRIDAPPDDQLAIADPAPAELEDGASDSGVPESELTLEHETLATVTNEP